MSDSQSNRSDIAPQSPHSLQIGSVVPGSSVDLSYLTEDQRNQLVMEYARGTLDVAKKAQEMHLDIAAFQKTLNVMAQNTKDVADTPGASVTVQHTQESSLGRTEVIMGNTAQAAKGKLSRTITGERDMTLWYVAIGAAVLILVVLAITRH